MAAVPEPVPRARQPRLQELDGLRAAAAIMVLFSHTIMWTDVSPDLRSWIDVSPFGVLVNGPGAVHIFFVLSGYVLALTLDGDPGPGRTARYYVRRLFRIQPPYMAAVLFAWALSQLVLPPGYTDRTAPWTRVPAEKLPVALAFPSMAFGLLPVGWSLFVEMAMSVVFPLLYLLGRRLHPIAPLLVAAVFLRDLDPRFTFLRFMIDFSIGLTAWLERERIAGWLRRLPRFVPALCALLGLVLLQLPYYAGLAATGYAGLEHGHSADTVAQFALGSGLLLVGALHAPRLRAALSTPIARFFGRISYSFYLIHLTLILAFAMRAPDHRFSWPAGIALTVIVFGLTAGLSELSWRLVEAPAIRAGRAVIRLGGLSRQDRKRGIQE